MGAVMAHLICRGSAQVKLKTWGAKLFGQVRLLMNIARRQGISAFEAIARALTSPQTDWLLS